MSRPTLSRWDFGTLRQHGPRSLVYTAECFLVSSTASYGEARAATHFLKRMVYRWCMSRTNIDIDEAACTIVMRRYGLATKREAVNFALREIAAELSLDEARRLRGSGWEGDLDQMRASRLPLA